MDADAPDDLDLRFFASIVEHLPVMLFVKDAKNLRFVRVNRMFEEMTGHERAALLGKSDFDFFHYEEAKFFTGKDREVLDRGELLDIPEEPLHRADGGERWLHTRKIPITDEHGAPRYLLGISEDITEAREAREALSKAQTELRSREAWLRVLLNSFPGVVWAADRDQTITALAGAHLSRLGLESDAWVGRTVCESLASRLIPAEPVDSGISGDLPSLVELHAAALAGETATGEYTDGERTYAVRLEPMVPELQLGALATALDITEQRQVERERIEARLQEAQKLESLGLLAGGIAHDFNNLLVGILGNASLALAELGESDSHLRPHLERIETASQQAADLTRQMLAYSGRGRFVVEPVDLSSLVQEMAQLVEVSVPKSATLELELDEDLPSVDADVVQIRQVVMNLITNAVAALVDAKGRIQVRTRCLTVDDWFLARTRIVGGELSEGAYVGLEVRDSGRGMDAATVDRMFDPFFTTRKDGHGLGLAAVLGILRGHGGAIRVDSVPGDGTTIEAFFPASTHATSQSVPTLTHFDVGPPGRVLVVDDEQVVRDLARAALERAGFDVAVAEHGAEALEIIRRDPEDFGLVLLDLTMPVMDGEETFRAIRKIRPGVRVLLSSGYNEQEATARFAGRGLTGFLQKPYPAMELVNKVRDLFDADGPADVE